MTTTSEMTNKRALATLVASKGEGDLCGQIKENNFRELIEIVFFFLVLLLSLLLYPG